MEELARRYLTDVTLDNGYIHGYTEDISKKNDLMHNIDTLSGGFVQKYNQYNEENEGIIRK